jgi:ATP-dependent RNA helicase RhlE
LKRQKALTDFKEHKIEVLVATDIAARGIDIEQMELVINYELPNIPETYVHRIGRTGRAGHSGKAISFCDFEEKAYLKDIEKLIKQSVPVSDEHPYPMEVFEIIKKEKTPRPPRVHQQKDKPTKEEKVVSAKNKGKKTWFGKRNRY